jgi:Co/Zn/Cd efflux system component
MCSAWTHVCADTLRSTTVLVVSFIATIFPTIDASEADAVAAVIVSFVIIGSLFPLLQGLVLTAVQIASQHRHPVTA